MFNKKEIKRPFQEVGTNNFCKWYTDNNQVECNFLNVRPILAIYDSFEEFMDNLTKDYVSQATEKEFAEYLLDFNLPENVEGLFISNFNSRKRKILERQGKIEEKKRKVLQSYR
jgi:hypothetical protein